jgi:hypothetical protein
MLATALLCFFLPFMTDSCGFPVPGIEIVASTVRHPTEVTTQSPTRPFGVVAPFALVVAFGSAIVAFGLSFGRSRRLIIGTLAAAAVACAGLVLFGIGSQMTSDYGLELPYVLAVGLTSAAILVNGLRLNQDVGTAVATRLSTRTRAGPDSWAAGPRDPPV